MGTKFHLLREVCIASLIAWATNISAHASTMTASYFQLGELDPTVPFISTSQPAGSLVGTIGSGLGPNGFPIVSALGQNDPSGMVNDGYLHDINSVTGELEWWSPTLYSGVTVLNNPVYPATVTLPISFPNFYTDATATNAGDDNQSFMTAMFTGNFTLTAPTSISVNACSDDDSFLYISGGVFGQGTLVVDNGGIKPESCTGANENVTLLNNVAPGNYTMRLFYADRMHYQAALDFSTNVNLTAVSAVPEPTTLSLVGLGLAAVVFAKRKARP